MFAHCVYVLQWKYYGLIKTMFYEKNKKNKSRHIAKWKREMQKKLCHNLKKHFTSCSAPTDVPHCLWLPTKTLYAADRHACGASARRFSSQRLMQEMRLLYAHAATSEKMQRKWSRATTDLVLYDSDPYGHVVFDPWYRGERNIIIDCGTCG